MKLVDEKRYFSLIHDSMSYIATILESLELISHHVPVNESKFYIQHIMVFICMIESSNEIECVTSFIR